MLLTGVEYIVFMLPRNFSVASKNKHSMADFCEWRSFIWEVRGKQRHGFNRRYSKEEGAFCNLYKNWIYLFVLYLVKSL